MAHFRRISSASISARRTTGMKRWRAAWTSGFSAWIAVETTTTWACSTFAAAWPTVTGTPSARSRRTLAFSATSLPCTV